MHESKTKILHSQNAGNYKQLAPQKLTFNGTNYRVMFCEAIAKQNNSLFFKMQKLLFRLNVPMTTLKLLI